MTPTDLNPERSEKYRYLGKLNFVPKLIIVASLALIISVVGTFITADIASDAWKVATRADIRSEMVTEQNEKMYSAFSVIRIRTAKMDAWLKAHGVPVEEVYGPELEKEYNEALKEIFE